MSSGPVDTRTLAAQVARRLKPRDLLVLSGDLGAGKTCFAQGLAQGLGIADRVTSPTFTLANRYEGDVVFNHLDVYRLADLAEVLDLDLPELLEDGVTAIEWGEQILPALGDQYLLIRFEFIEDETTAEQVRRITLSAIGESWSDRLTEWSEIGQLGVGDGGCASC